MAGVHEAVTSALSVPVVDGVAAAARLAESLVALGLSTSKVRSYAPPRAEDVRGWPLRGGAAAGGRSTGGPRR
jgi:allantoin racemase